MSALRILIVDDDPSSRLLARTILEHDGHLVLEAGDVTTARAALAQEPLPDLIACDIELPGERGDTFVESLRSDPRTANVVAVAVTVLDEPGILQTLLARGFDGYLRKPFDTSRFTEELVPLARRRDRCG